MPELPEVETIKLGLQSKIVGKKITDIEVLVPKIFIGDKKEVIGKTVVGIWRRAKILGIELDNSSSSARKKPLALPVGSLDVGPAPTFEKNSNISSSGTAQHFLTAHDFTADSSLILLFHLKLTGQLVFVKDVRHQTFGHPIPFAGTTLPAKSTAVIFEFNDGSKLFYNDVRKFGWIKVTRSVILSERSPSGLSLRVEDESKDLSNLGPEPLEKEFTNEIFAEILKKYKKPIKLVLMDQEAIAGVGNIYASEALFLAKIDPRRPANALKDTEAGKLYKSLIDVLNLGIKYQGSSENAYVTVDGEKGSMQDHFNVYGKTGEYCPNKCKGKIIRIVLGGRGTFFCPSCQH